ncbi:MAG TPA: hypothetical protein VGE76_16320 [Opitutaceae bacterium]
MSIPIEDNYRALLLKLINQRAAWADELQLFRTQSVDAPTYGKRCGFNAKAKIVARHLSQLDFILARNRKEIDSLGLAQEFAALRPPAPAPEAAP